MEKVKYIFPMCVLLATMKTVSDMCKHNEMSALRCMGISLLQIFIPFLSLAMVLVGIQFVGTEIIAPKASQYARNIHQSAMSIPVKTKSKKGSKETAQAAPKRGFLAFRNTPRRRDWLFRTIDRKGQCTELFIQQFDENRKVTWELRADSGHYNKQTKQWRLRNIRRTRFKEGQLWPIIEAPIEEGVVDELDEIPQSIDFFSKLRASDEMSVIDLWQVLRDPAMTIPQPTLNILWTSFFFRLFFPFSCVISVLLGVPMAVTTQRTGAMKNFLIGIAWMVSFYVVAQYFVLIGNDPRVPPMIAGGLPVLVYAAIGIRSLLKKL
jgi:lipopolysaccharide export system permease protein